MEREKKTVLEKVTEACMRACHARTPIIYLLTDEMELVDQVVWSECMVALYRDGEPYQEYLAGFAGGNAGGRPELPDNYKLNKLPGAEEFLRVPQLYAFKNFALLGDKGELLARYVDRYLRSQPDSCLRHSTVLLADGKLSIPEGLEPYVQVVEVPYPEDFEIRRLILEFNEANYREPLPEEYVDRLVVYLKGFRGSRIQFLLRRILGETEYLGADQARAFGIIKEEKEQMLKKSGVLRLKPEEEVAVGGLGDLKDWLHENKIILENLKEAGEEWGIQAPKGMLICGIPGSGKSLAARLCAQIYGSLPLLEMDMGSLMGKYLGESEQNMRSAMALADAMAPCVLLIDEIEKAFAGVGGSGEGGGALERSFAAFLSWLQERTAPCFLFATANDVSRLRPELLRAGRFDRKFYVFMPMRAECIEIFQALLAQLLKHADGLFEPGLVRDEAFLGGIVDYCVQGDKRKLLTGADIQGIINDAVKGIFLERKRDRLPKEQWTGVKITRQELGSALCRAIDNTRTYGENNLQDIARCFLSLQKNRFLPASGEDPDRVLFGFEDFDPGAEEPIKGDGSQYRNPYDRALFVVLKEAICQEFHKTSIG